MLQVKRVAVLLLAVLGVTAVGVTATYGGEVIFKNGDKLTGEVTTLVDGKLKIKSKVAGEVTVDLKDVASFKTDEPIVAKLKDGSILSEKFDTSQTPGNVVVAATTKPTVAEATKDGPGAGDVPTTQFAPDTELSLTKFDEINPPKPKLWSGNIKAGALLTRGNSNTDAANASADVARRTKQDRFTFDAQYLFARDGDDNNVTTDNWLLQAKYDYFFTKKLYGYTVAKLERDNVADLEYRFQPGAGLGYQWIESAKENFRQEIGAGYTFEKYRNDEENDYANYRYAHSYDRQIKDNIKFIHNFEILPSLEDLSVYTFTADAGIRVSFTKQFFLDLKAEWKENSDPGPETRKNDFRYILSVGWDF